MTSNGTMIASAAADLQASPANPEVVEHARRRQFTAAYKVRILREADGEAQKLAVSGSVYGALLGVHCAPQ